MPQNLEPRNPRLSWPHLLQHVRVGDQYPADTTCLQVCLSGTCRWTSGAGMVQD